jgi:hypothetical protein
VLVRDLNGLTLDDDVEALLPLVAAGREDHVRVAPQVDGLLFARAGGKVEGIVEPNGHERRHMGSAIDSDRRNPPKLRLLQHTSGLAPPGRDRVRSLKRVSSSVRGSLMCRGFPMRQTF